MIQVSMINRPVNRQSLYSGFNSFNFRLYRKLYSLAGNSFPDPNIHLYLTYSPHRSELKGFLFYTTAPVTLRSLWKHSYRYNSMYERVSDGDLRLCELTGIDDLKGLGKIPWFNPHIIRTTGKNVAFCASLLPVIEPGDMNVHVRNRPIYRNRRLTGLLGHPSKYSEWSGKFGDKIGRFMSCDVVGSWRSNCKISKEMFSTGDRYAHLSAQPSQTRLELCQSELHEGLLNSKDAFWAHYPEKNGKYFNVKTCMRPSKFFQDVTSNFDREIKYQVATINVPPAGYQFV